MFDFLDVDLEQVIAAKDPNRSAQTLNPKPYTLHPNPQTDSCKVPQPVSLSRTLALSLARSRARALSLSVYCVSVFLCVCVYMNMYIGAGCRIQGVGTSAHTNVRLGRVYHKLRRANKKCTRPTPTHPPLCVARAHIKTCTHKAP